ncbi:MAG: hypothetical protein HYZ34_14635 [Ignavibacteriae bacterium]|nr:hypothetical protein [Ignavibacteriota bacterium]
MIKIILISLIMLTLLNSCERPDTNSFPTNPSPTEITGTWIYHQAKDSTVVLLKSDSLNKDCYGFTIHPDGKFIERKNIGWCGTPPISYDNFQGTWQYQTEQSLQITVGYWGGQEKYILKIISLSSTIIEIYYQSRENIPNQPSSLQ